MKKGVKKKIPEWDKEIWVLFLLTVAGIILRIYNLGYNPLWLDESATYTLSAVPLGQIWENTAKGEFNPPLFYVIEHFMLLIANNEWSLRFMPALFGIFTIPVIYLVGKEFHDKYVGLIAAAAFTFSPFLIFYSQEARAYSLVLLCCSAMMLFYLKALKTNELKEWILFSAAAIVAIWTHFYTVVFIAALVSYAGYKYRSNAKPLAIGMALWFVACLPIFYVLVDLFRIRTATAPTYGIQGIGIIIETFKQITGFSETMTVIYGILFLTGLVYLYINTREKFTLIIWTILLTVIASLCLSFIIPMLPKYLIFLTIPLYLGVGISYRTILNLTASDYKPAYAVLWFIVFFGLLSAPFCLSYYQNYSKDNWRLISKDLNRLTADGDVVIAVPNYIVNPLGYYYNATDDRTAFTGLSTVEGLEAARLAVPNTTYYVITYDLSAVDPGGNVQRWLTQNSKIVKEYPGIFITRSNTHV